MDIKEDELKEAGLYQSDTMIRKSTRTVLIFTVCFSVLFLLLFIRIITSGTADVDGKSVYAASSFYTLMMAVPFLLAAVILFSLCFSNSYHAKKAMDEVLNFGDPEEAVVRNIDIRGSAKYVAFTASDSKCSACDARSSTKAKFCPECGTKKMNT
jgi:hypothetical protein